MISSQNSENFLLHSINRLFSSSKRTASKPITVGVLCMATMLVGCASPPLGSSQSTASATPKDTVGSTLSGLAESLKSGVAKLAEAGQSSAEEQNKELVGRRIDSTPLAGLFSKYPIDGTKKNPRFAGELWFPRVALIPVTVPSAHWRSWGDTNAYGTTKYGNMAANTINVGGFKQSKSNICWTFRAVIWQSMQKHTDVPEFIYCASEAASGVRIGGTPAATTLGGPWMSKTQSGSLFTTGPRQPTKFASTKFFHDTDEINGTYGTQTLIGLLKKMGIDAYDMNEGNRVWIADSEFISKDF